MRGVLCVPAKSDIALSAQLTDGRENVYPIFIMYQHTATPFLIYGDWRTAATFFHELQLLAVWELSEAVVFWLDF